MSIKVDFVPQPEDTPVQEYVYYHSYEAGGELEILQARVDAIVSALHTVMANLPAKTKADIYKTLGIIEDLE